jgi:hypothetical protein
VVEYGIGQLWPFGKASTMGLRTTLLKRRMVLECCPYWTQSIRKIHVILIPHIRQTIQRFKLPALTSVLVVYDRRLRVFVDMKREDIGSSIVADNIEIVFALYQCCHSFFSDLWIL